MVEKYGNLTITYQKTCSELKFAIIMAQQKTEDNKLNIVFCIACSKEGNGWLDKSKDKVKKALELGFDSAFEEHARWWQKFWEKSSISLPDKLAEVWSGLGGRNAKASLKIQGVYSLISSSFTSIELTEAQGTDNIYCEKLLSFINKGELLITDLGYFYKEFFNSLSEKGAYFLNVIRTNTVLAQVQDGIIKNFSLAQFLKDRDIVDEEVLIGVTYQKQLKC